MTLRTHFASAVAVLALITASGCAVHRDQETVGAYIDDGAITTSIKARFVENKTVDAVAIHVETLNGTVMLSGFAKSEAEKTTAEALAQMLAAGRNAVIRKSFSRITFEARAVSALSPRVFHWRSRGYRLPQRGRMGAGRDRLRSCNATKLDER